MRECRPVPCVRQEIAAKPTCRAATARWFAYPPIRFSDPRTSDHRINVPHRFFLTLRHLPTRFSNYRHSQTRGGFDGVRESRAFHRLFVGAVCASWRIRRRGFRRDGPKNEPGHERIASSADPRTFLPNAECAHNRLIES